MAKIMRPPFSQPAQSGEVRLVEFLRDRLPSDYIIIPNGVYPSENDGNVQMLEYDCLVVTPHGIYNIENKDYSEDQKQYLIECLEQGDSLSVIRKFASPNLSVKYMDQLRRILYERGY